tara:strand:+ start:558 stop:1109 length:552 start_codon:yes stop_codon:yes gene_type:complete
MALTTVRSTGIGSLPAISGANLTSLNASNISSGTLNSARFSGGKVLQVINAQQGSFNTNSGSFQDTGLTASITPSATSSKIFVIVSLVSARKHTNDTSLVARALRDSTEIVCFESFGGYTGNTNENGFGGTGTSYLDSPSSTSALTYKVQIKSAMSNATVEIGGWQTGSERGKSTISLMEIAV